MPSVFTNHIAKIIWKIAPVDLIIFLAHLGIQESLDAIKVSNKIMLFEILIYRVNVTKLKTCFGVQDLIGIK